MEKNSTEKQKNKKVMKKTHWKTVGIVALITFLLWTFRDIFFTKQAAVSILEGKREIPIEEDTGFRVIEKIPEKEGGSYLYEIRLKFSEDVNLDDFDVKVNPPINIKKVVVKDLPSTLWLIPEKPWDFNTTYNLIVTSINPDKKLKKPVYVQYEYLNWDGPVGIFGNEEDSHDSSVPKGL